jgi:hypothetical protein
LKETCQHLTDVLKLINRHGEAEANFGLKDMLSPTNKDSAKPKEGKYSEFASSKGSNPAAN